MVLSSNRCCFVLLGIELELHTNLVCNKFTIEINNKARVQGITIDNKLDFSMCSNISITR